MTALAHLTCASSTKRRGERGHREPETAGIENILTLRGDIRRGRSSRRPTGSSTPAN